MADLFSGNPSVKEGLLALGWQRVVCGGLYGYSWRDAEGNLYTESEAAAHLERLRKEEGRGKA